ncbi:hypothetical protein AB0C29_10665 [Actinoplanes sp. NPDC048791]|uniref:hypothetical protein n=1 Tax=Actinoplanes sp. NPDC048791 TaxID=3154623 RepID=UPI003409F301
MKSIAGGVPVSSLKLDPDNPRLPEEVQGKDQSEILTYLDENDVLDELADSFLTNGFFENEPLLVLPPDPDGKRVVVEGNRRAGTLLILLQMPAAEHAGLRIDFDPPPTAEQLQELSAVPAFEVADREEVSRYLGFRHISGLKTWDPEAKARYLWSQVEEAARKGSEDPFYEVGRRVGSNALGVRNAYNAYNILRHARDEMGLRKETQFVLREKFGVWTRLLGTANIPDYIGLPRTATSYPEVRNRPNSMNAERLVEVLTDLSPKVGQRRAVLQDSRDATDYSDVLANDVARRTLREYDNLNLARQVVENAQLSGRLADLIATVEVLQRDVPRMEEVTEDDAARGRELSALTRALSAVIESQVRAKADS